MNDIVLRPYQKDFIDNVRKEFAAGHKKVCGVAPCGAGKTIMTGWMIKEALKRGKRSLFFVHRKELIEQTSKTFDTLGIPHGIVAAGTKARYDLPVQIASVQTLVNRIKNLEVPDLIVCDECHHILANTYKKVIDFFPDAFLLGVTATPERMGGIGLGDIFSSMVESLTVSELISLGNLTPFICYAPKKEINLQAVHKKFGEYVNKDLEKLMTGKEIIGDVVQSYLEYAAGKSAICYCVNVKHSKSIADAFKSAGISAAHCDGETNKDVRADLVEDFRVGKIKVLCNAELFGEGFDVPNMEAVILARPTCSLTLYVQQSMRPMRPDLDNPDKRAIIIDHVKNYKKFGLPDAPRNWSLLPAEKKDEGVPPTRRCPRCGAVVPISHRTCPECAFAFADEERKDEIKHFAGEIVKIYDSSETKVEKTDEIKSQIKHVPKTIEDFMEIAKTKHYKIFWAALHALDYAKTYRDCLHIAQVCGYQKGWAWHQWQKVKQQNSRESLSENFVESIEKDFPFR